jgi:hypothetical protein
LANFSRNPKNPCTEEPLKPPSCKPSEEPERRVQRNSKKFKEIQRKGFEEI